MTLYAQGWDLVAVSSQTELNTLLTALNNTGWFPSSVNYSYLGVSFVGTLGGPQVNLNPTQAQGTNSLAELVVPITGTVSFLGNSFVVPAGTTANVITNLTYDSITISGTNVLRLSLDLASQSALYSIGLATPTPVPQWVPFLNALIASYLATNVNVQGVYYLGDVNVSSVPGALLPQGSAYFAIQLAQTTSAPNILALTGTTSTGTPGVLDFAPVPAMLPSNQTTALYIGNRCLLVNLVLPPMCSSLGVSQSTFTVNGTGTAARSLSLNQSIDISGEYDPDLDTLSVYVNGSGQIQGDYTATGYPLSGFHSVIWVDVDGYFQMTPAFSNNTITFSSNAPNGNGSIHLSTGGWIIVAALIIASFGTLGGALAAVVAIVVPIVITQLKLNVSMSSLQSMLNDANISFSWPAQTQAPITAVALPGDFVIYMAPAV